MNFIWLKYFQRFASHDSTTSITNPLKAMPKTRKFIMDQFQQYILDSYQEYCQKQEMDMDPQGIITYIIDQDIVPSSSINRFTVLKEFEKLYPKNGNHKTLTVNQLSNRYNLSERTIWGILKMGMTQH